MPLKRRRAFDDTSDDAKPCPACLDLMRAGRLQPRAVMPLPKFPARLGQDNRPCCRDCQATETTMAAKFLRQHPEWGAARLTVANERIHGTVMPLGLMECKGMCHMGFVDPSSVDDLDWHIDWLERRGIENSMDFLEQPDAT